MKTVSNDLYACYICSLDNLLKRYADYEGTQYADYVLDDTDIYPESDLLIKSNKIVTDYRFIEMAAGRMISMIGAEMADVVINKILDDGIDLGLYSYMFREEQNRSYCYIQFYDNQYHDLQFEIRTIPSGNQTRVKPSVFINSIISLLDNEEKDVASKRWREISGEVLTGKKLEKQIKDIMNLMEFILTAVDVSYVNGPEIILHRLLLSNDEFIEAIPAEDGKVFFAGHSFFGKIPYPPLPEPKTISVTRKSDNGIALLWEDWTGRIRLRPHGAVKDTNTLRFFISLRRRKEKTQYQVLDPDSYYKDRP